MPSTVWYSCSPFETGDIKTGSPTITISGGVATLSVAQTGNIGCGDCIEYASTAVYIAPNRLGFDSGGTTEIKVGDKIQGVTSGATGIIRAVELTSGSWSGGDAAGYFYFEQTTGTWQDNETINRIRPSNASDVATVDGTLQGNMGNGNTQFVVKTAMGCTPVDQSSTSVTSIHHEYASLADLEAGFTDANHLNSTDLTASGADVIVHACCYYDHSDYTADTHEVTVDFGTTDGTHYFFTFAPIGGSESVNKQRHNGKWSTECYRLGGDIHYNVIVIYQPYTKIVGLQLENTYSDPDGYAGGMRFSDSVDNIPSEVGDCIIRTNMARTYSSSNAIRFGKGTAKLWNVLIYGGWYVGVTFQPGADNVLNYYNNTVLDCYYNGIATSDSYTSTIIYNYYNNIVQNSGNKDFAVVSGLSHYNEDYNISSDDTVQGTHSKANTTVIFEDAANDDYHLSSSDTAAKDAGTDLSTDSYLPIWRDIDGEDRVGGTWDIGADEYVTTGGGGAIMNQFQKSNLGADLFNGSLL